MNHCMATMFACVLIAGSSKADTAREIMDATGIEGGLVVHLGCGDGKLTAALRTKNNFLVHGLDTDPDYVEKARAHIRSLGLYGPVSVDTYDGIHLPYADNLVNLVISENLGDVPMAEVRRVLCPGGIAYIKKDEKWTKTVEPWPTEIDQWTHHLHDAGNNPVANDLVVGPPRHLQWTAGPLWARSHGWTPSVSAMVSAAGRLFYICDESLTGSDATVPDKWVLTARDAFSGVLLWKRRIPQWGSRSFSGTLDTKGRFTMPPQVGKRIVASHDTVYVTLGATAPVTALDAATGKVRQVYSETTHADELLLSDGRLVVSLNQPGDGSQRSTKKYVCALDSKTGRVLWKKGPFTGIVATKTQDPFGRLELAAGDGQVFLLTEDSLTSLALDTGETVWQFDRPRLSEKAIRRIGFAGVYEHRLTVMVYHNGVVLLAQPEPNVPHTYHTMPGTLFGIDAKTGRTMWQHSYGGWGHCTPPDVFVIKDLVWVHENAPAEFSPAPVNGVRAANPAEVDYAIQALDLKTGVQRNRLPAKDVFNVGHHHRCYRNKITERFLMASRRGVEFVDLDTGENYLHHWVRSGCLLGNLPCNGLLYVAPHPCSCYIDAKLIGFNALAAKRELRVEGRGLRVQRLERGPAYGKIPQSAFRNPHSKDWPTYRHDGQRSGTTKTTVGAELKLLWTAKLGGRLSSVVVAENKVFVADVDAHTVHALDAADGGRIWQHTAGARVDSPPTVHQGLAIFGAADGKVRCLRASDGALVWQFLAAPEDRRVIAFDQLESVWPISGSVLVHNKKCWFAAGRSSYLDGGIHVFALDPATGRLDQQQTVYSPDPETGKMPPGEAHLLPGLLNDILATDGSSIFIRQMPISSSGKPTGNHLYSTAGYLDSSWFNRTFWNVGKVKTTGIMVLAGDVVYGVEIYGSKTRNAVFEPGGQDCRLTCFSLSESAVTPVARGSKRRGKAKPSQKVIWQQYVPIRITSMVRAAGELFVAGSPDTVDPKDPHGAWEGRKGGMLTVFDAANGKKLSEFELDAPPVWDSLIAAGNRLYLSTADGSVLCFGGK